MKIIIFSLLFTIMTSSLVSAYTDHNVQSANFIAQLGVINDNSFSPSGYNLDNNITRREMLKILMNLSGVEVIDRCLGAFDDIASSDWGCKYAEAAVKEGYIAANSTFRPDDLVTQIEALKMIMQGKGIERYNYDDWREGYKEKAESLGIIDDNYLDYNKSAVRGWIFSNSARSYSAFQYDESLNTSGSFDSSELPPEIKELFDNLGSDYDI